jgi:hypothetical protein
MFPPTLRETYRNGLRPFLPFPPWKASKNCARGSSNYGGIFDIPSKEEELALLERQASTQEFWNDATQAQKVQKQIKGLKDWIEGWASIHREV